LKHGVAYSSPWLALRARRPRDSEVEQRIGRHVVLRQALGLVIHEPQLVLRPRDSLAGAAVNPAAHLCHWRTRRAAFNIIMSHVGADAIAQAVRARGIGENDSAKHAGDEPRLPPTGLSRPFAVGGGAGILALAPLGAKKSYSHPLAMPRERAVKPAQPNCRCEEEPKW
jgi:hypothetical protein